MNLREYLSVLARRKTIVIAVTVAVTVAAVVVGLRSSDKATSRAVAAIPSVRAEGVIIQIAPEFALEREVELARSEKVIARAAQQTGESEATIRALITVGPPSPTSKGTIIFTATDVDATRASEVANAVAEAYVVVSNESLLDGLQNYLDAVRTGSAESSEEALAFLKSAGDAPLELSELSLNPRASALDSRLADLLALVDMESAHAQLVSSASPQDGGAAVGRNAILGLTLGLFLGVAGALVQEQLDDRVRTADSLRHSLAEVPTIDVTGGSGYAPEDALHLLAATLMAQPPAGEKRLAVSTPTAHAGGVDILGGLTAALGDESGITLVDAGPLLTGAGIASLQSEVNGVILVVTKGVTRTSEVTQAADLLRDLKQPLRGVVLVAGRS
ncbi:MAG: hypothetical protein RBS78_00240 [Coriobacteriia bacterium]|jgi:capsular polysaccharide biosynthesis protein|nr:hypothetical protein [Coriobacteriia bacterium]